MNLLRRLKLRRVALVEAGANPGAHISLFKAKRVDERGYPVIEGENTDEEPQVSKTADELQAELEKAETAKTEAEAAAKVAEEKAAEAERKLSETSDAELAKAREEVEKLTAELAKSKDADVQKALDETKDELAKLRKAERRRTFVEKARSYENLGKPEVLAPLLEAADEHFDEAEQKLLKRVLDGANEQVEKGALFAQLSDPDADPDEGWEERLDKAARERVSKSDSGLTIEQAKVQIMREDADLRREYQSARS